MSKNQFSQRKKQLTTISKSKINEYKEAFDIFDKDKNGIISINDIIKIINIFSYPISKRNIKRIIKEINISGKENFDFNNFVILMEKQNNYIDKSNEEMASESFKDKYLGKKRKKEKLENDDFQENEDKVQLLNFKNNIEEICEKDKEDNVIKIDESIDNIIPDIKMNKEKRNLEIKDNYKNNNINIIENLNSKRSVRENRRKNFYNTNYYL